MRCGSKLCPSSHRLGQFRAKLIGVIRSVSARSNWQFSATQSLCHRLYNPVRGCCRAWFVTLRTCSCLLACKFGSWSQSRARSIVRALGISPLHGDDLCTQKGRSVNSDVLPATDHEHLSEVRSPVWPAGALSGRTEWAPGCVRRFPIMGVYYGSESSSRRAWCGARRRIDLRGCRVELVY